MNKRLAIGMITIGQSPRDDLVHEIMNLARIDAKVYECGVLDGLSLSEIEKLSPEPGEYVLITRLTDGTPTRLAHSKIIEKVQSCIDSLINEGVDLLVILCSGEWPKFKSTKLVITPGDTLRNFIMGMVNEGDKLGIIVPDEDQITVVQKKWHREKIQIRIAVASPFGLTANDEMVRAATSLKESGVNLVAMDCIGYTVKKKRIVQDITGRPVVLVRSVLASIIREIAS